MAVKGTLHGLAWLAALQLATCAPGAAPADDLLTLEVASRRVPCQGEAPQLCLRVRTLPDSSWRLFYDPIAGFTHEEGYRYRLEVARRVVANPPADGSRFAYRLVRVRERVRE